MKRLILVLITALLSPSISAQVAVEKQTFLYSIKGADTLYMDRYDVTGDELPKPVLLFMFGGGFFAGSRDRADYVSFFNYMAEQGYCVVSIDYRLGLKDLDQGKKSNKLSFLRTFSNAITIAVDDMYDATNFVLANSNSWNIDRDKIVTCGSSAGAISVLQGEYEIIRGGELAQKLPDGFNYAGVISFAGAVLMFGDIKASDYPCPIMMFHGDSDGNVPYDKIKIAKLGFYGSKYLAKLLRMNKLPYWFYSVSNADHEIADRPMQDNREEIVSFLNKFVMQNQKLMVETGISDIGKPERKKKFKLQDYVTRNLGQ